MTTTSLFHLDKQQAQQVLKLNIDNKTLPPEPYPKYLGVALDRILAYRTHLSNVSKKSNSRTALIRKLAATQLGRKPNSPESVCPAVLLCGRVLRCCLGKQCPH